MLKLRNLLQVKIPISNPLSFSLTHFRHRPLSTFLFQRFSENKDKKPPKGFEHFKRQRKSPESTEDSKPQNEKQELKPTEKKEAQEPEKDTQKEPQKELKDEKNTKEEQVSEEKEEPKQQTAKPKQKIFGYSTENLSEAKKQYETFRKAFFNFNKRLGLGQKQYLTAFFFLSMSFAFNTITYEVY
jgi:hypothetical protein